MFCGSQRCGRQSTRLGQFRDSLQVDQEAYTPCHIYITTADSKKYTVNCWLIGKKTSSDQINIHTQTAKNCGRMDGVKPMNTEYRIEPAGNAFIVIEPWGERLVDVFPTEDAAKQDIERCKKEDAMYETAEHLVNIAIETHMQKFGVDRETASYWIHSAMGG